MSREVTPTSHDGKAEKSEDIPKLPTDLETRYWSEKQQIKDIYRRVGLWHGTGRFEDNGVTDVLRGICHAREISLHQDSWDPNLKTTKTVSATKIRPYAAHYSDIHLQPDPGELFYKDSRKINLATQRRLRTLLGLLRHTLYLRRQIPKAAPEWIERKTGRPMESNDAVFSREFTF